MLTIGSLFSGIGGLELGLERAGLGPVLWQAESDEYARKVLAKHWPGVPCYRDVRDVDERASRVDLICGGFPCQPFSSASRGRKRGTADDRWLWPEMSRVVEVLKPTWVVGENVTQFDGPGLEQVVSDLEACGYEVAPTLEVPACAFGHSHRRSRLWILGYSDRHREPSRAIHAEASELPRGDSDAGELGAIDGVSARLERLGNAVVPQVSEWIGRRIVEALK